MRRQTLPQSQVILRFIELLKQRTSATIKPMKLPGLEDAVIDPAKITNYLLSAAHPNGRHKAQYFARFGFSANTWQQLAEALIRHAQEHEVAKQDVSPFGIRYVIDGAIMSPDGRNPPIRAVWFMEKGAAIPYFVTAYPP